MMTTLQSPSKAVAAGATRLGTGGGTATATRLPFFSTLTGASLTRRPFGASAGGSPRSRCQTVPRSNWMVIPSWENSAPSCQLSAQMWPDQSIQAREGSPASLSRFRL